jgi:hypothetical protein
VRCSLTRSQSPSPDGDILAADASVALVAHAPLAASGWNLTLGAYVDGGNDLVEVGGPTEGLRFLVCSSRKRLIAAWRWTTEWKTPRLRRRFDSLAKKPSTALGHEHEVGVKWK